MEETQQESEHYKLMSKVIDYFIEKDIRNEIRTQERNKAILEGVKQLASDTISELLPQLATRAYQKFVEPTGMTTHPISEEMMKNISNLLFPPEDKK